MSDLHTLHATSSSCMDPGNALLWVAGPWADPWEFNVHGAAGNGLAALDTVERCLFTVEKKP